MNLSKGKVENPNHCSVCWVCFQQSLQVHPSTQRKSPVSSRSDVGACRPAEARVWATFPCLTWRFGPIWLHIQCPPLPIALAEKFSKPCWEKSSLSAWSQHVLNYHEKYGDWAAVVQLLKSVLLFSYETKKSAELNPACRPVVQIYLLSTLRHTVVQCHLLRVLYPPGCLLFA